MSLISLTIDMTFTPRGPSAGPRGAPAVASPPTASTEIVLVSGTKKFSRKDCSFALVDLKIYWVSKHSHLCRGIRGESCSGGRCSAHDLDRADIDSNWELIWRVKQHHGDFGPLRLYPVDSCFHALERARDDFDYVVHI